MDHPRWPERDLADGLGSADGQWFEEVLGATHGVKDRGWPTTSEISREPVR